MIMKKIIYSFVAMVLIGCNQQSRDLNTKIINVMCAELAGDFHLGDSRQLTDKSLLPFDLVS